MCSNLSSAHYQQQLLTSSHQSVKHIHNLSWAEKNKRTNAVTKEKEPKHSSPKQCLGWRAQCGQRDRDREKQCEGFQSGARHEVTVYVPVSKNSIPGHCDSSQSRGLSCDMRLFDPPTASLIALSGSSGGCVYYGLGTESMIVGSWLTPPPPPKPTQDGV